MIHLDESRRDEAIEAGWQAYKEHTPNHEQSYRELCNRWRVIAVCSDEIVIGALFENEGVIHIGIVPQWRGRWASRRVINQMLGYGTKTKLTPSEDEKFIARIGFRKKGDLYELDR